MNKQIIKQEDMRAGDTIRVEWVHKGAALTHTATLHHDEELSERVKAAAFRLPLETTGANIYLVNRPMQPLPTEQGSVILVTETSSNIRLPFYAALNHDGLWLSIPNGQRLHSSRIADWKEAKLVTVEDDAE